MMSRMLSAIAFTVAGALSAASDLHHSEYVDPVVKQADRGRWKRSAKRWVARGAQLSLSAARRPSRGDERVAT